MRNFNRKVLNLKLNIKILLIILSTHLFQLFILIIFINLHLGCKSNFELIKKQYKMKLNNIEFFYKFLNKLLLYPFLKVLYSNWSFINLIHNTNYKSMHIPPLTEKFLIFSKICVLLWSYSCLLVKLACIVFFNIFQLLSYCVSKTYFYLRREMNISLSWTQDLIIVTNFILEK